MKFLLLLILFLSSTIGNSQNLNGLSYANPSEVGLDSLFIYNKVDSIMTKGISNHAFPGAQLLVAKNNKIIFHKAYGFHTYDSIQSVGLNDNYDLASVTKIIGPLPAIMKLSDEDLLDLDAPFSNYWKSWKHKVNKKELTLREILAHQAGLKPYIVFLNDVLKKDHIKARYIKYESKKRYENQVYKNVFIKNRFNKKMYRTILRSHVSSSKKYLYSGLSFLLYPKLISDITSVDYQTYLDNQFYKPLKLETLGFLPKTKPLDNEIIPTELDTIFRKTLVHGWVHDENAALLGGISGNAGLFSNAVDLAIMMQMYMNYGIYAGKRYLKEGTVKEFTTVQYPDNGNRRALGFDKPLLNNRSLSLSEAYPAPEASATSFGHSGFTGTFVWADPEHQLVFIFLSNRVYPTRKNRNLYNLNIRPALHQVFYRAELNN